MSPLLPISPTGQPTFSTIKEPLDIDLQHIAGKSFFISGAAQGIGRALALKLAQAGAQLILMDKASNELDSLAQTINDSTQKEPIISVFDLCQMNEEIALELAQSLDEHHPHLDGVFHLAGMLGDLTPLNQYPEYLWQQVMQVNLNSAFLITQALLPMLMKAERAQVVFTTSAQGICAQAYWGAYAVSNSALITLTRTWADETRETGRVRFNAVDPGAVSTQLRSTAFPAEHPATIRNPQQALTPFLYLLSEPFSMELSGSVIVSDAI